MTLLERDDALAALVRALAASHPQGQIATVSGEAGVGKTALLEALAGQSPAASFLWGACEALGTPRPLGPLLDLAPELGGDIEPLVATTVPRHQVFAAFATAVARRRPPTCVVFEDVHWADEATLDLLRYVSRRINRIGALIVVTWRTDEVGADHSVHRLLGELPSGATHRLELHPLSIEAVTRIAGDTHDARSMFALTNGNPFFVTELPSRRRRRRACQRARGDPGETRVAADRSATGGGPCLRSAGASRDRHRARQRDVCN
jgi:predicted ATPase